ncbi:MAG: oxidoreductase, partial [Verrucomicrobiaceae bacterium]|nr:oxidoreductase [Verrucomicrobiaceae bacterium]
MSVLANRRKFISTAVGAAGLQIVPRHVLGGPNHTAPSEKLNIAGIGIGGMGSHNLAQCAKSEQVTALCDVDHKYAGGVMNRYPDAKRFHDYR